MENIHAVQRLQNFPLSNALVANTGCNVNLGVEMRKTLKLIYICQLPPNNLLPYQELEAQPLLCFLSKTRLR